MVEIFYFVRGSKGSVKAASLQEAIDKYYVRRRYGAGWGHYFVDGERVWV